MVIDEEVNSLMCISFVICRIVLIIFNLNSHPIVDDEVEHIVTIGVGVGGKGRQLVQLHMVLYRVHYFLSLFKHVEKNGVNLNHLNYWT